MADKIVLLKEGKKIFQFSIKSPVDSMLGETDIMIDTGKEMYFDHVILGNYFRHYKKLEDKINSISWHGYFKRVNKKILLPPKSSPQTPFKVCGSSLSFRNDESR